MDSLSLALGYLVVVLHEFWRGSELVTVGEVLEVSRADRNKLVGGGVARDATTAEIAAYRGEELDDGEPPDASEAIAALAVAKTELKALEGQVDDLQGQVKTLEQRNKELSQELDELGGELEHQKDEVATLKKALEAATKKTKGGA